MVNLERELLASLRLFNCYVEYLDSDVIPAKDFYCKGILFDTDVPYNVANVSKQLYEIDLAKLNSTFHKSFSKVADADEEDLLTEQIIHYFSTYGLESLGLYDDKYVYIPKEQLDIPKLSEDFKMIKIRSVKFEELQVMLKDLVLSDIALSKLTIDDILALVKYIDKSWIEDLKNKELKIALYEEFNIVPYNNIEFLRYLIYKLTDETLLIKNSETYEKLKHSDKQLTLSLLKKYIDQEGIKPLCAIFHRYRKIFMNMKVKHPINENGKELNHIINEIGRNADKYHKKVKTKILDNLTNIARQYDYVIPDIIEEEIKSELNNISIYKEISIYNSLMTRYNNRDMIGLYKIRNGKIFTNQYKHNDYNLPTLKHISLIIYDDIINKLRPLLYKKTFYIPDIINYKCPTSEKSFISNIPEGSSIKIKKADLVVGIHWFNLDDGEDICYNRVDLDLSLLNRNEHFGWNADWRAGRDILFTGDITSAPKPNGGSEAYYLSNAKDSEYLMTLNNYTQNKKDVPYEYIIGCCNKEDIQSNYIIKNIIAKINMLCEVNKNTYSIGIIKIDNNDVTITFTNTSQANSRITMSNDQSDMILKFYHIANDNRINLIDLLKQCGAEIVDDRTKIEYVLVNEEEQLYKAVPIKIDYDLSMESLTKTTFINMLKLN